ncbi:MAG: hypothetical protein JRN15_18600 [Nitrososphaerota archaeon]|nr:hypothetical protein [Nitrososphaerota archaeon]
MDEECSICNGKADALFKRIEVWSNRRWRLTTTTYCAVKGLCYLEPVRHIRYITEIDGQEASEFGAVLSSAASALKSATGAELIYVYIYGGHIPHLHVHLAPHREGDVFYDDLVKDGIELSEEVMLPEEVAAVSRGIGMNMPGKSSTG